MFQPPVTGPIILPNPPGGSPLARHLRSGVADGAWVDAAPRDEAAWRERVATIATGADRGAVSLVAGAAGERGAALLGGAAAVVTTGQQPGLFGGPLYTLIKALSAKALAERLAAVAGARVVPVFWAATDDSDFREAARAAFVGDEGLVVVEGATNAPEGTPLARIPLEGVDAWLPSLRAASGSAAAQEVIAAAERAYVEGATHGDAYVRLLRHILEPLGIAVVDASHPSLRQAMQPLLQRALAAAPEVERALAARTQEIAAAGFTAQVDVVPGLSLVFETVDGVRQRVPASGAAAVSGRADAALGPNVLLRPVIEAATLPTVAYVAGPGEYAYFAQATAVADALGTRRPLAVPRWSATIVEPRVQRVLARLGLEADEVREAGVAETRIARAAVPTSAAEALEALRGAVRDAAVALGGTDALLPAPALDGAVRQVEHRVARLERRLVAAVKRREREAMRDIAVARAALWPDGVPQERVLSFLPFVARHGGPLVDALLAGAASHAESLIGGAARDMGAPPTAAVAPG